MKKYNVYLHLAPPNMPGQNAAERDIQTFKNRFISGFSTADTDFLISE